MQRAVTTHLSNLTDESNQLSLWVLGIVFYGIGDIVTTLIGLHESGVVEVGPVAVVLLAAGGTPVLIAWKVIVFGVFYGVSKILPGAVRVAVPLGIAVTGVGVTIWNCSILLVGS